MKINFIIPFIGKTGGIMVVLEYLRQLTRLGHSVTVYYPLFPYWSLTDPNLSLGLRLYIHAAWFMKNLLKMKRSDLLYDEAVRVNPALCIADIFIRNADIVIATSAPTAHSVFRLGPRKGKKFYFVQGFETWYQTDASLCSSFRLPLRIVTISPWISRQIVSRCGRSVEAEVFNGIRHDRFYPPREKSYSSASILMMYSPLQLKGAAEGLAALTRITGRFPGIPVTLFGLADKPFAPFSFTYLQDPSHAQLLSAYQTATIFIFPVHGEGWGLSAVEAMACGCALIATRTGAIDALYNGRNALIIRPRCVRSICRGLLLCIMSEERRRTLGREGIKSAATLSWERSSRKLDHIFSKAAA